MRVQDARAAMCAFSGESQPAPAAVKFGPPRNQFLNTLRAFFDEYARGFHIDESISRIDGVLQM